MLLLQQRSTRRQAVLLDYDILVSSLCMTGLGSLVLGIEILQKPDMQSTGSEWFSRMVSVPK